jgi:uncharacterized protein (TIGR03437 family)
MKRMLFIVLAFFLSPTLSGPTRQQASTPHTRPHNSLATPKKSRDETRANLNITLRGHLDPLAGDLRYADVWGEGHYAYLATYNTPAPDTARGSGILIIDIANPDDPQLVGQYLPAAGARFQDVVVINGIGYFSSENAGGVHIVDVRNPASPRLLSQITTAQNGFSFVHELAVADGILYEADSRGTIVKAFDVRNPSAPAFIRNIQTTDTFFIHAITALNGRLYTSGWNGNTDIFDVRNILTAAPSLLGTVVSGDRSHSSWVSSDARLLVSARETINGDVRVFDISDPAHPVLRSTITAQSLGISAFSPHNPFLVGHLLFVSWYQAGLQVIDLSDPSAPVRVGEFDTYTDTMVTGFRGNWGVYPFLGFDRVLLSDMDGGLYVVDATEAVTGPRTVSAASFDQNAIAGRSIAAAFGTGLTVTSGVAGVIPLPTTLAGTTVKVMDSRGIERLAPLFFVSPTQINYQIPAGTAEGPATINITGSGNQISRGVFFVHPASPSIFTLNQDGTGDASALDAFTLKGEPFAATQMNGSPNIIAIYLTGLGEDATDADVDVRASVEAQIDGQPATVLYAGRAPGYAGLNQVNLALPGGITSGTHTLTIKRGVVSNAVTIMIG